MRLKTMRRRCISLFKYVLNEKKSSYKYTIILYGGFFMSSLQEVNSHTLNIENRSHIFMTGALNVENFDDTSM